MRRIVIQGDDDEASRAVQYHSRVGAPRIVEIRHLTGIASREPFGQVAKLVEWRAGSCWRAGWRLGDVVLKGLLNWRDTAQIKTSGAGTLDNPLALPGARHADMMPHEGRTGDYFVLSGNSARAVILEVTACQTRTPGHRVGQASSDPLFDGLSSAWCFFGRLPR